MSDHEKLLYGIRHFGIPLRDELIKEAYGLAKAGQLNQSAVDEAIAEYERNERAQNLAKYGTEKPDEATRLSYAMDLIEKLSGKVRAMETSEDFVNMYAGKLSSDVLRTSGLGGCIATLIYVEDPTSKGGILTHFPPLNLEENIEKIQELYRNNNLLNMPYQKGFVLHTNQPPESYIGVLKTISPVLKVSPVAYTQESIGTVTLDPIHRVWSSQQHGVVRFK